jgi:Flp pilus assembly pilin Flp
MDLKRAIVVQVERLRDESGQATVEYAVLAGLTVFFVLAAIVFMETALLDYFQDVASLIALPIP